MKKVTLRPIIKHTEREWIIPFHVPSWCSSCPPERKTIVIQSKNKPTLSRIKHELKKEGYEIND